MLSMGTLGRNNDLGPAGWVGKPVTPVIWRRDSAEITISVRRGGTQLSRYLVINQDLK